MIKKKGGPAMNANPGVTADRSVCGVSARGVVSWTGALSLYFSMVALAISAAGWNLGRAFPELGMGKAAILFAFAGWTAITLVASSALLGILSMGVAVAARSRGEPIGCCWGRAAVGLIACIAWCLLTIPAAVTAAGATAEQMPEVFRTPEVPPDKTMGQQMLLDLARLGGALVVGIACGSLPMAIALGRRRLLLAPVALVCCSVAGIALGAMLAIPLGAVFTIVALTFPTTAAGERPGAGGTGIAGPAVVIAEVVEEPSRSVAPLAATSPSVPVRPPSAIGVGVWIAVAGVGLVMLLSLTVGAVMMVKTRPWDRLASNPPPPGGLVPASEEPYQEIFVSEDLRRLQAEWNKASAEPDREPLAPVTPEFPDLSQLDLGPNSESKAPAPIPLRDGPALSEISFTPYQGEKQTFTLPGKIGDVVLGAGGRLILLYLPERHEIAVYDVNQAKISQNLSLRSHPALIAAGYDDLIVVFPSENLIERWSLKTLSKETTRPLPVEGLANRIAIGYASRGPMLVHWAQSASSFVSGSYSFIDLQTLQPLDVGTFRPHNGSYSNSIHLRAAATGRVFGLWATDHSPQGMETLVLATKGVTNYYEHDSAGHIVPSYDGSAILTGVAGIHTSDRIIRSGDHRPEIPVVPSTHPRFYVAVPAEPEAQWNLGGNPFSGISPAVHAFGSSTRIATLPSLELGTREPEYGWSDSEMTLDKRVVYVPQADQLVTFPFSNDRLVVQRFNLLETLDQAEVDYFYLTSGPPPAFRPGETYRHRVEAVARRGTITYALTSGPPGMAIDHRGSLAWRVPDDFKAPQVPVVVTVKNSDGQTLTDRFTLQLHTK